MFDVVVQIVEGSLENLDASFSNASAQTSRSEPFSCNPVPRPSWRAATSDWSPCASDCAGAVGPLSSLRAELCLKMEMLDSAVAAVRRQLDAARAREREAVAERDALRRELDESRTVYHICLYIYIIFASSEFPSRTPAHFCRNVHSA